MSTLSREERDVEVGQAPVKADEFIAQKKVQLLGQRCKMKDVGRRGSYEWTCEAITLRPQSNLEQKVYAVARMRLTAFEGERAYETGEQIGDVHYRFGYYIVSPLAAKWWWGQSALMLPAEDLAPLLRQAEDEGTILPILK